MKALPLLAVLTLLGIASSAYSRSDHLLEEARSDITLRATIDSDQTTLSGNILLTLTVEGPARLRVTQPKPLLTRESAQSWLIRELEWPLVENLENGRQRWRQQFRLSPYEVGAKVTLALAPVEVSAGNAPAATVEWSHSFAIHVSTSIVNADLDMLKPITGAEDPAMSPPEQANNRLLAAALMFGVALITALLIFFFRRHRRPISIPHNAAWAIDQLANLDASERSANAHLGEVLRSYIAAGSAIPASQMTTAELLAAMKRNEGITEEQWQKFKELLEACDLAKFAPGEVFPGETEERIKRAIALLQTFDH